MSILDRLVDDEGYRTIAFDRAGSGFSGRPRIQLDPAVHLRLIRGALRQLGVEQRWLGIPSAARWPSDGPSSTPKSSPASCTWPVWPSARNRRSGSRSTCGDLSSCIRGRSRCSCPRAALHAPHARAGTRAGAREHGVPPSRAGSVDRPLQFRAAIEDQVFTPRGPSPLAPRYREITEPLAVVASDGDRHVPRAAHADPLAAAVPGAMFSMPRPGTRHSTRKPGARVGGDSMGSRATRSNG
jgi:hypothetical protein